MIIDEIFKILFFLPNAILGLLPDFAINGFTMPDGVYEGLKILLCNIAYLFPIKELLPILYVRFSVYLLRLSSSALQAVKDLIKI